MRRKSFGNADLSLSCGQTKVERADAINHTAQALCKGMCVSSFHCLRVFVLEGENYLNMLLLHTCLFVCLFFLKKIFRFEEFPDTCRQGLRILC